MDSFDLVGKLVCATASTSSLHCRVINKWDAAHAISGEWDELAKRVGASIALSPTYTEIWWKHYGRGVLTIVERRLGDRLVGIFPMFLSTIVVGIVPVRVATFLTSDSTIVVLTPPLEAEYAQRCWMAAVASLLEAGAEVISFSPLSGESGRSDEARAAIAAFGLKVIEDRSPVNCTVYDLPSSIEAYMSSLKPQTRKNFRRAQSHLASIGKYDARRVADADSGVFFEGFIRLHTDRWNADGLLGHFADWPGSVAFHTDLVDAHAARKEAFFIEIRLDGKVIAAVYAFIYGSKVFARLNARLVGTEWNKARLGNAIQYALIDQALACGVRRIDSGPGHYQHKVEAGGSEFPLIYLAACRPNIICIIKAFALTAWSGLWHYAYYRAWRGRLLSKLGIKPKPLVRTGIQTRL